jgi:regulatory protein
MKERNKVSEKQKLTPDQALARIYKYCAYQERSHLEVKNKLYGFGLFQDDVDEILSRLIVEGFLNEERFAKAFSGGKFRMQHWGRNKIIHALESKGLTKNCINKGLKEIPDSDYHKALTQLIEKKSSRMEESNLFIRRDKIARFAISKGFEPELVWSQIRTLID